eukprot:13207108-Ditylum_brightwellii.AAC.1
MSVHIPSVDADLAGNDVTRQIQTGVLIFLNKAPIHWHSRQQATVEVSTFGAEFIGMQIVVEMAEAMGYKLRMFGVSLDGPTATNCDDE